VAHPEGRASGGEADQGGDDAESGERPLEEAREAAGQRLKPP
jgi:hypothetical protein